MTLGEPPRPPVRVLVGRVPQAVADARCCRFRAAARKTGRTVRARRLAVAAWTRLGTHVPAERLTGRVAASRRRQPWLCLVRTSIRIRSNASWRPPVYDESLS